MVTEAMVKCPKCKHEFKLTESLAAPLIEHLQQAHAEELAKVRTGVDAERETLKAERKNLDREVEARLAVQRTQLEVEVRTSVQKQVHTKLDQMEREKTDLETQLTLRNTELADAQRLQAAAIKRERELADKERALDLTIEQRVSDERRTIIANAERSARETFQLEVDARELTISQMKTKIEELQQKAMQGSQQLQGEVQELELEAALREAFPVDTVEPVGKGILGADCLQTVMSSTGARCGTILWESKRTKNWGGDWLAKLRDDQRARSATLAVIMSRALPDGVDTFALVEGIWVCAPRYAVALAVTLRCWLVQVEQTRGASEGQKTKAEVLYQYMTGTKFRQRVEALVENLTAMRDDLDKERRAITKQWAKREEQLHTMVDTLSGLFGDVQGIAGKILAELVTLDTSQLEA